jgi:hypothetical protein
VIAAAIASASPYGTVEAGRERPKPSRACSSSLKPTIVVVRPWKLPSATMMRARPGDALDAVAPGAGDLDAGLDGLGAGVHRQHESLPHSSASAAANGRAGRCGTRGCERDPAQLLGRGGERAGWRCPKFTAEYAASRSR